MNEKSKFAVGDKVIYHSVNGDQVVTVDEFVFIKDTGWLFKFAEPRPAYGDCKIWVHESLLSDVRESSEKS